MDGEENELKTLVENRLGLQKVTDFMCRLRTLGLCGREAIKQVLPELAGKKQYLAACVLSHDELEKSDEDILDSDGAHLHAGETNFQSAYVSFDRAVVLMNDPIFSTHGETRLLDPDANILNDLLPHTKNHNKGFIDNLMDKMTRYYKLKGERYVIFLFSHLIPCTEPHHNCSKLIREYVSRTGEHVIVAYEKLYGKTNMVEALNNLLRHQNIYVMSRSQLRQRFQSEEQTTADSIDIAAIGDKLIRQLEWEAELEENLCAQQCVFGGEIAVGKLWTELDVPYNNFEDDDKTWAEAGVGKAMKPKRWSIRHRESRNPLHTERSRRGNRSCHSGNDKAATRLSSLERKNPLLQLDVNQEKMHDLELEGLPNVLEWESNLIQATIRQETRYNHEQAEEELDYRLLTNLPTHHNDQELPEDDTNSHNMHRKRRRRESRPDNVQSEEDSKGISDWSQRLHRKRYKREGRTDYGHSGDDARGALEEEKHRVPRKRSRRVYVNDHEEIDEYSTRPVDWNNHVSFKRARRANRYDHGQVRDNPLSLKRSRPENHYDYQHSENDTLEWDRRLPLKRSRQVYFHGDRQQEADTINTSSSMKSVRNDRRVVWLPKTDAKSVSAKVTYDDSKSDYCKRSRQKSRYLAPPKLHIRTKLADPRTVRRYAHLR